MAGPLMIGSIVWAIAAIIVGWFIINKVEQNSSELKKEANTRIALVAIVIGALQMWLMWITCYMHQMYPLITPKIQF